MKIRLFFFAALSMLVLFAARPANAAFVVKKSVANALSSSHSIEPALTTTSSEVKTTKHSFFSRLLLTAKRAVMSKVVYIILSIIGFGWLAMGLNENFEGLDWLLCLLLYFIFYIPGLVYSLIKMSKFY